MARVCVSRLWLCRRLTDGPHDVHMKDIIWAKDIIHDSSYFTGGAGSRAGSPPEFWNWRFCLEILYAYICMTYIYNILHYKSPLHVFHIFLLFDFVLL